MKYNVTAIRKLIIEAFGDEELTTFCYGHFREVTERFESDMSKSNKVLQLVTYCSQHNKLDELLAKVEAEHPEHYQKYKDQLEEGADASPAPLENMLEGVRSEESDKEDECQERLEDDEGGPSLERIREKTSRMAEQMPTMQSDVYSPYEAGLRRLLNRMGRNHPHYSEALVYQQRLTENISHSRLYGDTTPRKSDRAEIIAQLNRLALSVANVPFIDLCGLDMSTTPQTSSHSEQAPVGVEDAEESAHPLTGDLQAVNQWFVEELGTNEQVFVIAAALFSGLERQELMGIYDDMLNILRPPQSQTEGRSQDG